MRGNIISSSFRQVCRGYKCKPNAIRPSTARERFGWSKRRFSTSEEKMKIVQEDLVCPVKYFKEEVQMLESLTDNDLIEIAGGVRGRSLLAWLAGRTIRSLPELIAKHHASGASVGPALRLDNIGVSRSEGRFGFRDMSEIGPAEKGSLLNDWKMGGNLLAEIAKLVLGDTPWPKELAAYVSILQSPSPKKFRLFFYSSLFLAPRARYWLKVFVDQSFRKDAGSLPRKTKKKADEFMGKLPYYGEREDEGSLLYIVDKYEVMTGALRESRIYAQVRAQSRKLSEARKLKLGTHRLMKLDEEERREEEKQEEERRKRDSGRWVVSVNRDTLAHGTKTNPAYLVKVNLRDVTAKKIWQMMHLEFDELDQRYIELCNEEEELWVVLGIEEIFYETPDTWKKALEALLRDVDVSSAKN